MKLAASRTENKEKCTGRCGNMEGESSRASLAALEFVAFLPIGGWWDTDVHHIVAWRLVVSGSVRYLLL